MSRNYLIGVILILKTIFSEMKARQDYEAVVFKQNKRFLEDKDPYQLPFELTLNDTEKLAFKVKICDRTIF